MAVWILATGFALDGRAGTIGGTNADWNWTEVAGLPAARMDAAGGVLNSALYAVGGYDGGTKTNVYHYDGTNWTEVAGLPAARYESAAGVLNGALYAVGGDDGGHKTNVYRYDGTNWTEVAGLPAARTALAAEVLNGALYAVGGVGLGGGKTNVYRYPASLTVYSGVAPSSGSWTGGYQVVISGTNLCDDDVTNVTICGVNVSSVDSMAGSTQVIVTAGAGTPGLGDVRVYSTSAGLSVGANTFTYLGSVMTLLGTNGAAIASGDPASAAKGTDFGSLSWGSALTNTFAITNSGNTNLTISGVTTNGTGASAFSILDFGFSIEAGTASNFNIKFAPPNAGTYTAAVEIANDSTTTSYIVYLAGTGAKQDQAALTFSPTTPQTYNTTNGLSASGGSGTGALSYAVAS